MGKDHDSTIPFQYGISTDGRHAICLSTRCGNDHARIVITIAQMVVDRVDRGLLVGT